MSVPIAVEAPAKLNLSLSVLRRRPDGFHELSSVFVLLELADRLLLMPGCAGLRVETADGRRPAGDELPPGPENLAWRGLLAGLQGEPDLTCLTLEKRVPIAAGLGGGSSDAGAAWRLGRRWRGVDERPDVAEVAALAAIGADVPFFASAVAAAHVTGIGERVTRLPVPPPREVLLVHPPFSLATGAVFTELREADWTARPVEPDPARAGHNDLLAAACRLRPELDEARRLVTAAGLEPHLTGSGPTLFALPEDEERATAVAARLELGGLRVTRTRTRATPATIEVIGEEEA